MTWTYGGDPSANSRDAVRFLIGDTDTADQQLTDAEIAYLVTAEGGVSAAAVAAVRALLAKFARLVDKSVGDLSVSYSQRRDQYQALLGELKTRHAMRSATPFAGGISLAQKDSVEDDSDRVPPAFERDQFRIAGTDDSPEENLSE